MSALSSFDASSQALRELLRTVAIGVAAASLSAIAVAAVVFCDAIVTDDKYAVEMPSSIAFLEIEGRDRVSSEIQDAE